MAGTRWVKLDVDYFRNPKIVTAGADGQRVHIASICWVGGQLTDGHIPAAMVESILADVRLRRTVVDRVVGAGLWVPNGDGFDLHDYLTHNPSRAQVEKERERWREQQRRRRS